jgi:hypothetical protein
MHGETNIKFIIEDVLLKMQLTTYVMSQIFSRDYLVTSPMDNGRIALIAIKQGSCWLNPVKHRHNSNPTEVTLTQ